VLWGHGSADNLDGGRDTIYTGPKGESAKDAVDAGAGFDRATADSRDVLDGCNRASRP
jgi:hypothetical protein